MDVVNVNICSVQSAQAMCNMRTIVWKLSITLAPMLYRKNLHSILWYPTTIIRETTFFIESVRDISTSPNINKTIAPFGFLCNDNSSLELWHVFYGHTYCFIVSTHPNKPLIKHSIWTHNRSRKKIWYWPKNNTKTSLCCSTF